MKQLLLVAWLSVASQAAGADEGASARAAFAEGERAFREDDYGLALERFRRAMELAPHDAVRFNVAVCLERLGRFREAHLEYETAARSKELDAVSRERAREQAARVRERLGRVLVEEPSGAEVFVDGSSAGVVPCEVLVDPRLHDLEVREATRSVRATFEVGRGETKRIRLGLPSELPSRRAGAGPLTWVGGATGLVGFAAFIGFGLRATTLHESYLMAPTVPTRDEGILMRDIANVSLVVGIVGALLTTLDLVWLAQRPAP